MLPSTHPEEKEHVTPVGTALLEDEPGERRVLSLRVPLQDEAPARNEEGRDFRQRGDVEGLAVGRVRKHEIESLARRGVLDAPPLTLDQLRSLSRDNVADVSDTVTTFGGEWRRFRPGIREYLSSGRHDPRSGIGDEVELERRAVLRVR